MTWNAVVHHQKLSFPNIQFKTHLFFCCVAPAAIFNDLPSSQLRLRLGTAWDLKHSISVMAGNGVNTPRAVHLLPVRGLLSLAA